jgi:hypothetical protein
MCVIIDANLAGDAFRKPCHADLVPVWNWIMDRDGCVVYGGRLEDELGPVHDGGRLLMRLSQAGKAKRCREDEIDAEEKRLKAGGLCRSDDPHVIALARVSGARVLCSRDQKLHGDFKNPNLINGPRGTIYQNASHARLLKHSSHCPGRPRK